MEINILGQKLRLWVIIVCMLIGGFIAVNVFCSCSGGGLREGFSSASDLMGATLDYSMGTGVKGSWDKPRTDIPPNINQSLEGNVGGPVPLPEGELFIWRENKSDPNCCPGIYSTSTGCICSSPEQMNYLNERGGNRTIGYGDF